MTEHPITSPAELVEQWRNEWIERREPSGWVGYYIATQAAQWGADQELEACCKWVKRHWLADELRAARRPKPPSLKEQALTALSEADQGLNESEWQQRSDTIRRALESLSD